ncbi:ankyrin repeat domain-containing protein [Pseudothauera lacus]|uniref:Ankyrin n=1 Tax=Pseudothauera lacus TaxID=2136175 RepID=A0A2T4III6_9RHOO|nr:ankyrin repeat domain-containing protein [Pseudothauera lacus]PTD97578.1 hypothetical protein C8261_02545 [Pseudothauera lacus]
MTTTTVPQLGEMFRALINAGGYRGLLTERGLDKDLDDLAGGKGRRGTLIELFEELEDKCSKEVAQDCGNQWAELMRRGWLQTRGMLQGVALQIETSPLPPSDGRALFNKLFGVPLLSLFIQSTTALRGAPDLSVWLLRPFKVWVEFAAKRLSVTESTLLERLETELDADTRSLERWLNGEPISKLTWPYARKVKALLASDPHATGEDVPEPEVHLLAGWLLLSRAFQSLPLELRDAVRRDFMLRKQQPWVFGESMVALGSASMAPKGWPRALEVLPLIDEIQNLFNVRPLSAERLRGVLDQFGRVLESAPMSFKVAYQPVLDWFAARAAATCGDEQAALELYEGAVNGAWWRAGKNQIPMLEEALTYAVGVGAKDAANTYWDKTFMLGVNRGPKPPLDAQEMRRIAFAFELKFHPQKAKHRIPPEAELVVREEAYAPGRKELKNPNQKTKYVEGCTRRTPLMNAVSEGSLDDVKQLVASGGDPNDFLPESGEGPLSYAMRRACDRHDPIIMEYLLSLDLAPETVNRRASTLRETPLKIAIEMADAKAVSRLIELGADVEAPCDTLPSALCFAMHMLSFSLHGFGEEEQSAYFEGKTPATSYDAKDGAVLDIHLAARRYMQKQRQESSRRNREIRDEVFANLRHPTEDCRKVIQALMAAGADANRGYRVEPQHLSVWTPILYAAQLGDLEVFRMLVEHPGENRGDPNLPLMPPNSLERFDALWVAIDHGRHAIVSYLMEREKGLASGV